jgi:hypothetical protein
MSGLKRRRKARKRIPARVKHQNGYIERFNCISRQYVLDAYLFEDIVQIMAEEWMQEYKYTRPHKSPKGAVSNGFDVLCRRRVVGGELKTIHPATTDYTNFERLAN